MKGIFTILICQIEEKKRINDKSIQHLGLWTHCKQKRIPFDLFSSDTNYSSLRDLIQQVMPCLRLKNTKVGKIMKKQGFGNIINIGSTYGIVAPDQRIYGKSGQNAASFYSATKSGVINLTRYLASYWANSGIRVNTLSPGGVKRNQDKSFIKNYSKKTMIGRMAKQDEYVGAIVFLASDASSYMTGSNLIIDGGWTAK